MKYESEQLRGIEDWGLAIKKRRQFLGMSQDQLAKILNVSRPTLDKWENGFGDINIRAVDWVLANNWVVCPRCDGRGFCKDEGSSESSGENPELLHKEENGE